ncbi:MAG: acyl-ACP--UDP-N-acetylglucosamine O-acyltransferase [Planctomycetota bacterium]
MPTTTPSIHPSAIIDPRATIADSATVGPNCIIEGDVTLAEDVTLTASVHLKGPVTIGARTRLYPFVAVGFEPQDYKFGPDAVTAGVTIGEDCLLREHVSIHCASNDHTPTRIGNRVFMMTSSHAGHDCQVHDDVVMVSGTLLGGHVIVEEKATLGGNSAVHQHCRVGKLAMLSGGVAISADLPPFCTCHIINRIIGANVVGIRRAGFSKQDVNAIKHAVGHVLRRTLPKGETLAILDELGQDSEPVRHIAQFVRTAKKPICAGAQKGPRGR